MAKTFTIDNVQLTRFQVLRTPTGDAEVYIEYALRSGTQVVDTVHRQVTTNISATRKAALVALLDGLAQDAAAIEQL